MSSLIRITRDLALDWDAIVAIFPTEDGRSTVLRIIDGDSFVISGTPGDLMDRVTGGSWKALIPD